MTHVNGEIIIQRRVEEVFDFVADERNEPLYNPAMKRSELITLEPIGQGSRFQAVISVRGQPVEMTIEFTAYERPRFLASSTSLSGMDIQGVLTFEAVPEGTRMRWSWEVHAKGLLRLAGPLVARMGQRQEETIWSGLKHYVEAQKVDIPSLAR